MVSFEVPETATDTVMILSEMSVIVRNSVVTPDLTISCGVYDNSQYQGKGFAVTAEPVNALYLGKRSGKCEPYTLGVMAEGVNSHDAHVGVLNTMPLEDGFNLSKLGLKDRIVVKAGQIIGFWFTNLIDEPDTTITYMGVWHELLQKDFV